MGGVLLEPPAFVLENRETWHLMNPAQREQVLGSSFSA